jgi:rhodanese-related sulfurtransferase
MKDFSVIEFETYLKNNQPLLLDVREQWEWDKCHFENVFINAVRFGCA